MGEIKYTKLGTHIKVQDFEKSRQFYEEILQFPKIFEYGPQFTEVSEKHAPEAYRGMTFDLGSGILEIADGHRAVRKEIHRESIPSSKVSAMIHVVSLVPVIERCKQYGITLAAEPRRFYWGTIEIVLIDPDGYRLVIIAQNTPEEAEKVSKLTGSDIDRKQPDYWAK